jgi:pectinesterase
MRADDAARGGGSARMNALGGAGSRAFAKNIDGDSSEGVKRQVVVAIDGSGDYASIQQAVDAIPAHYPQRVVIKVRPGVYREKLHIERRTISLIGEDAHRTVIYYDDYAMKVFPNGELYHTFNSYTALIGADDFVAEQLSFVNGAGYGEHIGQAVAAYVDGDRAAFFGCRFIGRQDTLFTGPLPEVPFDRSTFGGPREGLPRRASRQYYEDCYIEGDVDFIFGSATAVFAQCEIVSRSRLAEGEEAEGGAQGFIAAPSTPQHIPYGYVFANCRLTGDTPSRTVYLGRPWRIHAKAAFLNCWMGEHIKAEGWHNWGKRESETTTIFAEYGNSGPGAPAGERVSWSRQLNATQAEQFATSRVLAGADGWNPLR